MSTPLTLEDVTPHTELVFSRSSGPGGQHVNKVNSRVTVRFDLDACAALSDAEKRRIRETFPARFDSRGLLHLTRETDRSQHANREAALVAVLEILERGRQRPKTRRPTRPTRASRERRLRAKRQQGEKKRQRQRPGE